MRKSVIAAGLGSFAFLAGCAMSVNEDVVRVQTFPAFGTYEKLRRVAVIPFGEYHVPRGKKVVMGIPRRVTEFNGRIMSDIFTAELKKKVRFKVIRPEKIAEFFKARGEKVWGILTPREVQRVAALLKVDSLIMGQVEDFSIYKYRTYENSRIALRARMADGATGQLVWKGRFKLDQEGKPHEVARRGASLLIEQVTSRLR